MSLLKWWFGCADGKNVVISRDKQDLPEKCTPAPLSKKPTPKQVELLHKAGIDSVRVHHES